MAKKYIDTEAFFKLINTTLPYGELDYPDKAVYNAAISDMCGMLTHFPAADVQEVRRAKWEYKQAYKGASFGFCVCSACGKAQWTPDAKYCPNCGAAMKGSIDND